MAVTIADIADRLNISIATVSRSLAQDRRVHPATRAKVAQVAMELGYQGRSRRQRKDSSRKFRIAVVLQGPGYQGSINAIKILEGLTAEADGAGARVSVGLAPQHDSSGVTLPAVCSPNSCDLTILMGRHDPALVSELVKHCHVVSATTRYESIPHDQADTADFWGMHHLAMRVLEKGHRKLAWVPEATINTGSFEDVRRAGLMQACLKHHIQLSDVHWLDARVFDENADVNPRRIKRLLDDGVTCFVCVTDRVAFQIIGQMHRWGIDVPGRVSVTGFDAVQSYMPSAPPTLTSIDPSWVEIGRAAMSLALRRLTQPSAPHMTVTVGFRFVEGDTLAEPH